MAENNNIETQLSEAAYSVFVSTWTSPRYVAKLGSYIYLQIATCYPCMICLSRESQITNSVLPGVSYEKHVIEKLLWISFTNNDEIGNDINSLIKVLKNKINIEVRPVTKYGDVVKLPMTKKIRSSTPLKKIEKDNIIEQLNKLKTLLEISNQKICYNISTLVAALVISYNMNVEEAAQKLKEFSEAFPQEDISNYKRTGVGGPKARIAESILNGYGGIELLLFAISSDKLTYQDNQNLALEPIFFNCQLIKAALEEMSNDKDFMNNIL